MMIHKLKFLKDIKTQHQVFIATTSIYSIVEYYQDHYHDFSDEWHDVTLAFLKRKRKQVERFQNARKYKICA